MMKMNDELHKLIKNSIATKDRYEFLTNLIKNLGQNFAGIYK